MTQDVVSGLRDRPAEDAAITPEMIAAGAYEAKEHALGEGLEHLVWRVYLAMDAERHKSVSASATSDLR